MLRAEFFENVFWEVDTRPIAEVAAVHVRSWLRVKDYIDNFLGELRGSKYLLGDHTKSSDDIHLCCDLDYSPDAHL